jgi:hypothetical protein
MQEAFVFTYLLTNEKTSTCGIYEITPGRICYDLRISLPAVKQVLNKLMKDGKIVYSDRTSELAILNWRKYHNSRSPKFQKRVDDDLAAVKNQELVSMLMNEEKPVIPDEEEEGEQLQLPLESTTPLNIPFSDAWNVSGKRGSKHKAELIWNKLKDKEREAVMAHAPLFIQSISEKKFIPHFTTYLNGKRWEDESSEGDGQQDRIYNLIKRENNEW